MIFNPIIGGKKLPILDNPGSANDLLEGKQLIDQDGNPLTGTIPVKTSSDVSVNGANIVIPSGYYSNQVNTSVESVEQVTPSISVSSSGLITASSTQSEGYVSAGTKSSTKQLSTQAGTTITPSVIQKTAITAGKYTTGPIYVAGSSNLIASNIKSGVNIFGVTGSYEGANIFVDAGVESVSVTNSYDIEISMTKPSKLPSTISLNNFVSLHLFAGRPLYYAFTVSILAGGVIVYSMKNNLPGQSSNSWSPSIVSVYGVTYGMQLSGNIITFQISKSSAIGFDLEPGAYNVSYFNSCWYIN